MAFAPDFDDKIAVASLLSGGADNACVFARENVIV
jgi:hypothetical protein